jgi:hypothetical protein
MILHDTISYTVIYHIVLLYYIRLYQIISYYALYRICFCKPDDGLARHHLSRTKQP